MRKQSLLDSLTFLASAVLLLCFVSCNDTVSTNSFTGVYYIDKNLPSDSTAVSKLEMALDWKLILASNNNFQLYGKNKNITGYWAAENHGDEYRILFQGGGMTTRARFNGKEIYFDKPETLLDSIFSQVTFLKKEKK